MAQKEFKVGNFAKLFNYNVFFGDYLQYISWAVKNSKTVDTLVDGFFSFTLQMALTFRLGFIFRIFTIRSFGFNEIT